MPGSVKDFLSVLLCLVVLGISLPAAAQNVPVIEVSGGYKYLRGTPPGPPTRATLGGTPATPGPPRTSAVSYPNGWYLDLGINTPKPKTLIAIVGQIGMSRKTIDGWEGNTREFMGGVRLNIRKIRRTVVFGQFLAGGTNSKFGNVHVATGGFDEWTVFFTEQLGGGVSMMVHEKVGLRLGVDYLRVHGKHDSTILNTGFNMIRVAAGIVLPFGTR
jgi:hypothetical protein